MNRLLLAAAPVLLLAACAQTPAHSPRTPAPAPLVVPQNTSVSFSPSRLTGAAPYHATSLQFGPDGRLYVATQEGLIHAYGVQRNAANSYAVTSTETITLVQQLPNHNDDGTHNTAITTRQVTGLLVTGTAQNPVLYVTSSDPRIGAGGGGEDLDLDTNSGIISRLTCTGTCATDGSANSWDHVQLVRGLPRSEENHASNGLAIDTTNNILYVAQGGNTNAGAPSNNFAFQTEYALAATILNVDLNALASLPIQGSGNARYVYDLPTLNDPTRTDGTAGDVNDPFGGNDGLNQAKLVAGGPVQIHSPGWRNVYDLVITQNGRMYAVDNGANQGWGGHPEGEGPYPDPDPATQPNAGVCTNQYVANEPGSTGPGPNDPVVNNLNGLHYVRALQAGDVNHPGRAEAYYAGHPTPIRGNPSGAGLYVNGTWYGPGSSSLPADWPPVPTDMANPAECDFRNSGETDGALVNYDPSTNGIAEYTASNFNGALTGNLLMAAFDGNLFVAQLATDGKSVLNCPAAPTVCTSALASNFGSLPIDVTAQGDNDIFPGTIWIALYGEDAITVLEPADYDGDTGTTCTGTNDPTLDEDGDGYKNDDEIANGTDPCSASSKPRDHDGDLVSDLKDTDDDNDGQPDTSDPFALDMHNGKNTNLPVQYDFFNGNPGTGIGGLGLTGLMTNGTTDYLDLFNSGEVIFGGTSGLLTVPNVSTGDPYGTLNTQENAFQFGANVSTSTGPFTVHGKINAPFFNGATNPSPYNGQGIFIGTGDQDNYVKLVLSYTRGFELLLENNGAVSSWIYPASGMLSATAINLYLRVDPAAGTIQGEYALPGGTRVLLGEPISLSGKLLSVVQGTYSPASGPSGMAAGVIATAYAYNPSYAATWDFLYVTADSTPPPPSGEASAYLQVTPTGGINASTYTNGAFTLKNTSPDVSISKVTIDLRTSLFPNFVFDPNGTAGDDTAKPFTVDLDTGVGTITPTLLNAHGNGGYDILELGFTNFTPGQTLGFSIDVDPLSIAGSTSPGPGDSGSVSGLELTGATITVHYSDGSVQVGRLFRGPGDTTSGSEVFLREGAPPAPTVGVLQVTMIRTQALSSAQAVRVSGPAGAKVALVVVEGAQYAASNGHIFAKDEANSAIAVTSYTGTIGPKGFVDFSVPLSNTDLSGGLNYLVASILDANGQPGAVSNIPVLAFR